MTDVLDKPLNIGDKVVYANSRYADLNVGTIVGFTNKKVKIEGKRGNATVFPDQMAKVE